MHDRRLPSAKLDDLLHGRIAWENAEPAIQSWAAFFVHGAAVDILSKPTKEKRQKALSALPDFIRDKVDIEARRVYAFLKAAT